MNRNWLLASLIGGSLVGGTIWYQRKRRRESPWSVNNSLAEVVCLWAS
jgi:LPXTG-motif cell wall-anchored protein